MTKQEVIKIFKDVCNTDEYTEEEKWRAILIVFKKWNDVNGEISTMDVLFAMKYVIDIVKRYGEIGTVEECKMAVERMRPQKPELFGEGYADGEPVYDFYRCPNCQEEYEVEFEQHNYCPNCGQHLDWSEGE